MVNEARGFSFEYIPLNIDKSSIKVFKNTKDIFSLEYAIFDPKTVLINMYPVIGESRFRKRGCDKGIASIQQFSTSMGLHQDFHKFKLLPIQFILEMLNSQFKIKSYGIKFFCGGIIGLKSELNLPCTIAEGFTDEILEILTDSPQFAFIQFIFMSTKVPKELQIYKESRQQTQIKFNTQQEKVERRFNSSKASVIEEMGCFKFSPRVLIVETSQKNLKSKLERLYAIFNSIGLKTRIYPTLWHRFSSFQSICLKRKLISPIVLDGYSLMNFISPPQQQFCYEGYTLVPNKSDYLISSGIRRALTNQAVNIGIPIISGKTSNEPLLIDGKDLSRHMAVFGMTGEGKSRFIYGLVKEFHEKNVKFLIFDPKGEYLHPVQSFCSDFIYLKPGSEMFPWGINIFQIPQNDAGVNLIPLEDHIQFVVSILENIFGDSDAISPQMRKLLHEAVVRTIESQGDLQTFISWVNDPNALSIKGAYLENSAAGIVNRMEKLLFGNTGRCFKVTKTTFDISNLLNQNAIIDLSGFETIEDQIGRKIFLEVVFQYLYYFAKSYRTPLKEEALPKNVFILDEIQKLVTQRTYRFKASESMIGKGPWTLRAYDISMIFIGTDPIVDQPMLTNTGTMVIFFSKFDPYVIANLLGISRNEYEQLRCLLKPKRDERRCIISINGYISLVKTHDFNLPRNPVLHSIDLQDSPFQKQLRKTYQKVKFNPIQK
ncbi:MAG: ATP-binding protein [Candidatus Hodarchaeota archaeon]